jgi:thiol-disulfide isomerase/thioredoxin
MRNVAACILLVACLAAVGSFCSGQVPDDVRNDRPDVGLVPEVPEDKGDILVVYSATWCGPCQAMRPQWTLLRSQGYKVVYIDIDNPHAFVGAFDYITTEIVDKALEKRPRSVPTLRYYNSSTRAFLKHERVGYTSLDKVKERLWKPSSSRGLVPELRR